MPEISVRGLEMPESPIRKLAPLAAAAKKKGTKVYHLNIGQPDLPTPQVGLDALKTIDREILEYSPSQGYLSYREKLVDYYAKYDIKVTAEDITLTADTLAEDDIVGQLIVELHEITVFPVNQTFVEITIGQTHLISFAHIPSL